MLNASGKARNFYDDAGRICGILYHPDDRAEALAYLQRIAPAGSTLLWVRRTETRTDVYVLTANGAEAGDNAHPRAAYASKPVGSLIGRRIYDRGAYNDGINGRGIDYAEATAALAREIWGNGEAYTPQVI